MRAKGTSGGDGPPAGVRVPAVNRRDGITPTRGDGPRVRRRHAGRDQPAVLAPHEGHPHVVLPGDGGT